MPDVPDRSATWPSLIDSVPVITFTTDHAGIVSHAGGGGLAMRWSGPEVVVGDAIFAADPEQRPLLDRLHQALRGASTTATVTVGGVVYQLLVGPLRDRAHAVIGAQGLLVALAEGRPVERLLAVSEARYGTLVTSLADGVVVQDAEGRILASNASAERILGLPAAQLVGRSSRDLGWRAAREDGTPLPGAEHPAMLAHATGQPQLGVTMAIHRPDGALRRLVVNAQPLGAPGADGPQAVVVSFTDSTAQGRAVEVLAEREAHFRALTELSADLVVVADARGRLRYHNPAAARVLGFPSGMPTRGTAIRFVHPDDRPRARAFFAACLADERARPTVELRLRHADGSWRDCEVVATNLLNEPAVGGLVLTARDITARKAAEAALRESEARLRDFLDSAGDLIQSVDPRGRIVYANRAWHDVLGYTDAERAELTIFDIIVPEDREQCRAILDGAIEALDTRIIETTFVSRDGCRIAVEGRVTGRLTPDGTRMAHGIFRDVTARRAREADLARRATHDGLTGLPNRSFFRERLDEALARAARAGQAVAVIYLDLDGFKAVNDELGHAAGDALLAMVAERLRETIRDGDLAARLGGDEFAVLLEPAVDAVSAARVTRRVLDGLAVPFRVGDAEVRVAASVGVALSTVADSADTLVGAADTAMYNAKRRGKGRYMLACDAGMEVG